jgi:hypothetical protein
MLLFIGVLLVSLDGNSQIPKIHFDYDAAGNQITRLFCTSCAARNANSDKNVSDLDESDLQKFHPDDNFSYYPNPVKGELYLKWDNSSIIKLQAIKLYSLNGSLLNTFENQMNLDNKNIQFEGYPNGFYFIELSYNNGEVKTIKIIKQ